MDKKEIGKRIQEHREMMRPRMSQTDLGLKAFGYDGDDPRRIRMAQKKISAIERGLQKTPRFELEQIAEVLETDVESLLGKERDNEMTDWMSQKLYEALEARIKTLETTIQTLQVFVKSLSEGTASAHNRLDEVDKRLNDAAETKNLEALKKMRPEQVSPARKRTSM